MTAEQWKDVLLIALASAVATFFSTLLMQIASIKFKES